MRARTREGRTGFWLVIAFCFALAAPGVAVAHEAASGEGHAEQDSVALMDAATESRLADETVARSSADATAAAAAVVGNEGEVGQWGPLTDWPVVGIHVALFSNGKVLAWDASNLNDQSYTKTTDHTFTRATVFDPATGTQTAAWVSGHNIFCAGLAHLTDGTLFAAGGNADQFSNGIVNTYTFSPASNAWTLGADMQYPRWYPSVTPLTNGEMLITGGRPWLPEARRDGRQPPNAVRSVDGRAVLPLDGRRARWPRLLLRSRRQPPQAGSGRDRNMAELRSARRWGEPRLREPRPL